MTDDDRQTFEDHVIDHYEDPYHRGPLEYATHAADGEIPICGDEIRIELRIAQGGVIEEAWFDGDGCVASQASASMLVERIEGMNVDEAATMTADQMLALLGKRLPPNRQKCCLLAWRVLHDAMESPIEPDADEDGLNFGGPSLSEEC